MRTSLQSQNSHLAFVGFQLEGSLLLSEGCGKVVSSRLMFRLGQTCVGYVLLDDKLKKMIGPTDLVVHREAD